MASVIFYFVSVALIAAVSYKLGVDMTTTKMQAALHRGDDPLGGGK